MALSTKKSVLARIKRIIAKGKCAEHFDVYDEPASAICVHLLHDDGDYYTWLTFNIGASFQDMESTINEKMRILQDKVNEISKQKMI